MGFLADMRTAEIESVPPANVANSANLPPDIRNIRNIRNDPDPQASQSPTTRQRIIRAAQDQGIDAELVLAHLDPEDIEGYADCHDRFLRVAVLAVRDAALRGTCSCDRCKARRRTANAR